MRATGGDRSSQLRIVIDTLRLGLRSRLAVFRNRKREEEIERELAATRQAHVEQVTDLNRRAAAEIAAIRAAYSEQIQQRDRQIAALTEAATESARQLQREKETDYQLLMVHQNLLAEFKDMEPELLELYEGCKAFTMTSIERLYSLYKSIEYLCRSGIAGDLAECGVWRGGSCMLMARVLLGHRDTARRIFMYDTFAGHPRPDAEKDIDIWGNRAIDEWQRREASGTTREWGFASLAETRANLTSTGYPEDRLVFVEGMVEKTVPESGPERLALLRLDTDWYESARAALHHLYPRLVPGGILIIDDYGHYKGQRQAVDSYFREIGCAPLLHRIDYSCRVMVKPPAEATRRST